jgi:hypothetical protein
MSQGEVFSRAKKVTVIIEDEKGLEYRLIFAHDNRPVDVETAINREFRDSYHSYTPCMSHVTSQHFTMRVNF